jgi:DNA-binding NtrC family response regulator
MSTSILIVEDDDSLNEMLRLHFEDQGFEVEGVSSYSEALQRLSARDFGLVLLDQQLPDGVGLDLLTSVHELKPGQAVIMMTGHHDLELAIDAIKTGASEFVHKPIQTDSLQQVVDKVLAARRTAEEGEAAGVSAPDFPRRGLIGRSEAMLTVSKEIALSAGSRANVLITGESGTGKEVVARLVHQHSGRPGPFVAVNCAAIVDTLLESELFGHEKGAFTGAAGRKPGKFELAQKGTLFLDEVGELAPPLQAKLLRALQEKTIERVGGIAPITVDVRVIAATNRDLFAEARAGHFREDLIYRLNVVGIHLPPLRDRIEDIPLLAAVLLEKIAAQLGTPIPRIEVGALEHLQRYSWPGNVRELENVLTQAAVRARGGILSTELFRFAGEPQPARVDASSGGHEADIRTLDEVEAAHIQKILELTGGHKGRTCQILNISRPALDRKIKKYRLNVPRRTDRA